MRLEEALYRLGKAYSDMSNALLEELTRDVAKSLWCVTRAFVFTVRALLHPRKTYHRL